MKKSENLKIIKHSNDSDVFMPYLRIQNTVMRHAALQSVMRQKFINYQTGIKNLDEQLYVPILRNWRTLVSYNVLLADFRSTKIKYESSRLDMVRLSKKLVIFSVPYQMISDSYASLEVFRWIANKLAMVNYLSLTFTRKQLINSMFADKKFVDNLEKNLKFIYGNVL